MTYPRYHSSFRDIINMPRSFPAELLTQGVKFSAIPLNYSLVDQSVGQLTACGKKNPDRESKGGRMLCSRTGQTHHEQENESMSSATVASAEGKEAKDGAPVGTVHACPDPDESHRCSNRILDCCCCSGAAVPNRTRAEGPEPEPEEELQQRSTPCNLEGSWHHCAPRTHQLGSMARRGSRLAR